MWRILTTDGSFWFESGKLFTEMREADISSAGGDSGAPVYGRRGSSGAEVFGVLKGGPEDGSSTIYSHVHYVLRDLDLDGVILASAMDNIN